MKLSSDNNGLNQNLKSLQNKLEKKKESLVHASEQLKTKEEEIESQILLNKEASKECKKQSKEKASIQCVFPNF